MMYINLFSFVNRGTCQLCEHTTCHRYGGSASAWQDLHIEKTVTVPQLDRHQHKRYENNSIYILSYKGC